MHQAPCGKKPPRRHHILLAHPIVPGFTIRLMAKLLTGPMISEIRGKCGDVVFARNRGGMFSRAQGVRVQPWSTPQISFRTVTHTIGLRWNANLTEQQRLQWNAFAATMAKTDQLRQAAPLSGQNWWFRINVSSYIQGPGYIDEPPPNLEILPAPLITAISATATPQSLLLTLDRSPGTDEYFNIAISKPLNVGRYNFARLLPVIAYIYPLETYPHDATAEFNLYHGPLIAGKKLALFTRTCNPANGQQSGSQLLTTIIS